MQVFKVSDYIHKENVDGCEIPIVNLGAIRRLHSEQKKIIVSELDETCRKNGFFYIEDHGIPESFLKCVEEQIDSFFNLPEEEKLKIHIAKSPYHRGYVPLEEENALGSPIKDVKEVFDMALELPLDDPDVIAKKFFHGPNAWPDEPILFKPTLLRLYDEWRMLGEEIAGLFAEALHLPSDYFVDKTNKPLAQLRIAKYPPQQVAKGDQIGCGAHTDYSIVSFIWQVDIPGLQIMTRDKKWINAPKIPGTFACLIGDAMAMWTNDYWPATIHRVINTANATRYSSAFFFDPNADCEIKPMDRFVHPSSPARYQPTTMSAHVKRGFDGTFTYRAASYKETI